MAFPQERIYTMEDIYALPDGQRAQLIDGRLYLMSPPNRMHQKLRNRLSQKITNYIDAKHGICEVYAAPFAVFLSQNDTNYVEPDISVICNLDKLDDRGCNGAPDWVIEILSPSTEQLDCGIKLFKYRSAGVREYWIVNPRLHTVNVYDFQEDKNTRQYSFDDGVQSCIFEDLVIKFGDLLV